MQCKIYSTMAFRSLFAARAKGWTLTFLCVSVPGFSNLATSTNALSRCAAVVFGNVPLLYWTDVFGDCRC